MNATRALLIPASSLAVRALALVAAVALSLAAVGAGPWLRAQLGFGFGALPRRPEAALEIAATNLRLAYAALLGAWAVAKWPRLRPLLDAALGLLALLNLGMAAVALGAYGPRLLGSLALHGALELAAFCLCASAYLAARQHELSARQLAGAACLAGLLLCAGALVETYLRLGASP